MLELEEMCMFDQLPSYVYWNLTQMQRTNIDADLLLRGFSLRHRDQCELWNILVNILVRQPGSERAIKVGFCSTHLPEKNFYHGWADIPWVIKIQPVVQFQGGAVPRKPLRKTGVRNTKKCSKAASSISKYNHKLTSFSLQNRFLLTKSCRH